jgi:hypothetical protein
MALIIENFWLNMSFIMVVNIIIIIIIKYKEEVLRQFVRKMSRQIPHCKSVRKLIDKFRDTGSVVDRSERPPISEDNIIENQD